MDRLEFTEKLAEKFPSRWKQIDSDDIEHFIDEKQLTAEQIDTLYNLAIQTYPAGWRTFPTLSFIRALYDQMAQEGKLDGRCDFADHGTDDGAAMSVQDIITRCRTIRAHTRELKSSEIDFIHAWDGLVYVSEHLEKIWSGESHRIESYLNTIKSQILRRERINFSGLPVMNLNVSEQRYSTKEHPKEPQHFQSPFGGDA